MTKIADLLEAHKGEWLAIALPEDVDSLRAEDGDLIYHAKTSGEVWRHIRERDSRTVYVVFAGPPLPPGTIAAF